LTRDTSRWVWKKEAKEKKTKTKPAQTAEEKK
jgi:hypothetical protein